MGSILRMWLLSLTAVSSAPMTAPSTDMGKLRLVELNDLPLRTLLIPVQAGIPVYKFGFRTRPLDYPIILYPLVFTRQGLLNVAQIAYGNVLNLLTLHTNSPWPGILSFSTGIPAISYHFHVFRSVLLL